MAGTFSQIYVQVVFAVKNRLCLIHPSWENELYKYISGIIKGKGQKPIIVNGMPDHIHLFAGIQPSIALSDLVRDVKNNSTNFIKIHKYVKSKFEWQAGFGAFSYSHSQIQNVYDYILHQKEHHMRKSFRDEYLDFLEKYEIIFDEKYLFDWIE